MGQTGAVIDAHGPINSPPPTSIAAAGAQSLIALRPAQVIAADFVTNIKGCSR